jgi:hypothetical protein
MLTGVLVFVLFLIALLAIPVTLTYQLSWPQDSQQDTLLEWAFGLVKVRIPVSEPKALSSAGNESKRKTHRSRASSGKRTNVLAAIRLKPFRQRIVRFIGDMWQAIHKKNVSLRVRVGLGDPADTGQLWAIVGPIAGLLATTQGAAIAIEPEFSDSTFELNTAGSIRVIPLQLILVTIALLLSPPIWQGIVQMQKGGR